MGCCDLQDQYDRALGRLYTMRNYFQWNRGVDREYISAYDKDWRKIKTGHKSISDVRNDNEMEAEMKAK